MGQGEGDIADLLTALGSRRDVLRCAQELIEALPVPVYFKGRDGRYLGVNRALEDLFCVSRAEIIGGDVRRLYAASPRVGLRHRAMDEELWKNPGKQSYEIELVMRDGRVRHTIYYKATFTRADGEVVGMIGTIIDITESKQAERREAIEHAITRFLGSSDSLGEAIRGIMQ